MSALAHRDLDCLLEAVQTNCHISDARHAQDMTLCTYLLAMREHYRWEAGLPPGEEPPRAEVGRWLAEREALWATLGERDFVPVPVGAAVHDPFAVEAIDGALEARSLVYGAGIGRFGKPHFFLGELAHRERREGVEVIVVGCELARDLQAPPAALQNGRVYLRLEALERWLWTRAEAWGHRRGDGAMRRALADYGYFDDPRRAMARMARAERETLVLHELGEHEAGRALGREWEDMVADAGDRRAELALRAVRDHLADCLVTLPRLIERSARGSLHFWFANLEGMRRELAHGLVQAYQSWVDTGEARALADAAREGRGHWTSVALRLLAAHREGGAPAVAALTAAPARTLAWHPGATRAGMETTIDTGKEG